MSEPEAKLPRVCVLMNKNGFVCVVADAPCEVFTVDHGLVDDRVYRLTPGRALEVDPKAVDAVLAGESVGHMHDGRTDLLMQEKAGRREPN